MDKSISIREIEVEQREKVLQKVHKGIKISPDERLWLQTHSVYNWRIIGDDIFNQVVERTIPEGKWLKMSLKVESVSYERRIVPEIIVPGGKGKIVCDWELTDLREKVKPQRTPIEWLCIELDTDIPNPTYELDYISDRGLYGIAYRCDYYDERMKIHKREGSSTGNPKLAIRREPIDDHTIRYYCKSPISDSFDALVFTVGWALNEELNKPKCK